MGVRVSSVFGGVLCVLLCVFPAVPVLGQLVIQNNIWLANIDLISARSARIRFLSSALTKNQQIITQTIIQYSNVATLPSVSTFHSNKGSGSIGTDDHEIAIVRALGDTPITSYTLRNLLPSTNYTVQLGYYDTSSPPALQPGATGSGGTKTTTNFVTPALSGDVSLVYLHASGCGSLSSTGSLYYLTSSTDSDSNLVYSCTVAAEISSIVVSIIPNHAYASITTATTSLSSYNSTLPSPYVDPLTIYNTTVSLGAQGTVTTFNWTVTAENLVTKSYVLSVTRAVAGSTAQVNGPSSPVVAFLRSPTTATVLSYHALLWQNTRIASWKAWSDDLSVFPFSALNVTTLSDVSYVSVSVTPAVRSSSDGSCSPVRVALFDQSSPVQSYSISTCITAIEDNCSTAPYGVASTWQSPFNTDGTLQTNVQLYYPAPPYVGFPTP